MPADDKRTEIVEDADTPDPHARTSPHPFRFRHRVKGGTLPQTAVRALVRVPRLAGRPRRQRPPRTRSGPAPRAQRPHRDAGAARAGDTDDRAPRRCAALERGAARDHRDPAHDPRAGRRTRRRSRARAGRRAARRTREPDARPDPPATGRTRTRDGRVAARPGRLARCAGRHRHHPSALRRHHPRRRREPVAVGRGAPRAPRPRRQPPEVAVEALKTITRPVPFLRWDPVAAARRSCPVAAQRRRVSAGDGDPQRRHPGPRHRRDHGDRPGDVRRRARPVPHDRRAAPRTAEDDAVHSRAARQVRRGHWRRRHRALTRRRHARGRAGRGRLVAGRRPRRSRLSRRPSSRTVPRRPRHLGRRTASRAQDVALEGRSGARAGAVHRPRHR